MNNIKRNRINSELVRTISEILLLESNDEFLKSVTITSADVSNDLSFAKVYFTTLGALGTESAEKEMNEASDFIRKFVAEKMDLRQTPKLKFVYDESIEYGNKIEGIIKSIHEKDNDTSRKEI